MTTNRKKRQTTRSESTGPNLSLKQYSVTAKTEGQKEYLKAIHNNRIVFCFGPAGCGKSFCAAAEAVLGLANGRFNKIILTRPLITVENERIGFLPGDGFSKTRPFLQPIYDELQHYLSHQDFQRLIRTEAIEVCTLGNMRGRTFLNSFIIVEEAQNISEKQLKSLLTRIGTGSKMVISGDPTQSDLPGGHSYDFIEMAELLDDIGGIESVHLTRDDIVRDPLVQKIVDRFEEDAQENAGPERGFSAARYADVEECD